MSQFSYCFQDSIWGWGRLLTDYNVSQCRSCEFILLNVLELLRYAGSYIFSNWEFFNHYFCKYFFYFFILLSLSGTPIMHMLAFLVVSHKSLRLCSFFITFLIFAPQTRSFYLTYLQLHWFFCLLKFVVEPL